MVQLIQDLGSLYPTLNSKHKARYGLYKCFCGNEFKTQIQSIKRGATSSCGCYRKNKIHERSRTHGLRKHRIYFVWNDMIQRCTNPKCKSYKNYGKRGITICDEWLNIENFINDMYPCFEEGLTLDRINNDLGYSKGNCRWTTQTVQVRNTRKLNCKNTSGYRGVHFSTKNNNWISKISINHKAKHLGVFNSAINAAKAYDKYVIDNNLEHTINGVL